MNIQKINKTVKKPDSIGIFHDTRKDAKVIRYVLNILINKVDELIESNNELHKELTKLKEG